MNLQKHKCKKCGGIYYDDQDINKVIDLQIKIFKERSNVSEIDLLSMNPVLKANHYSILYSSKRYLEEKLDENEFLCRCNL